jgi:hypothetical protein
MSTTEVKPLFWNNQLPEFADKYWGNSVFQNVGYGLTEHMASHSKNKLIFIAELGRIIKVRLR